MTKEQNEECKHLLTLMGVPVIDAPCEAEAQCAKLVQSGKVYATATEDMDALTFGSTILVRHMTFSEAKKIPIKVLLLLIVFRILILKLILGIQFGKGSKRDGSILQRVCRFVHFAWL